MMTPRERWLAAVRMQPVDRLPFWPKINGSYARAQRAPFRDMSPDALHQWIGSDRHMGLGKCVRTCRSSTSVETIRENGTQRTEYRTPLGVLTRVDQFDEPSQSWHPVKHPVQSADDIRVMKACFTDLRVELDAEVLERSRARAEDIGQDAVTTTSIGVSPLMDWIEHIAGIETGHHLLHDCTEEVEDLFDAMHRVLMRNAEILSEHSPADLIYVTENTSTLLISPTQYREYCFRHIMDYAEAANAHNRLVVLHMCGHLKDLLADLSKLPVAAFEAFTSPTLGNTTLLDGRTGCPDKCLIGGTNAMLWTRPADEIIARIEHDLDELPHHRGIVVTSAGVMPPMCEPETIRQVCRWVKDYPARMNGA